MGVEQLLFPAVVGLVVGFLSGTFGIGGSFLIVPVLNIALDIPMNYAVGAGCCQVLGPATTSLLARRLRGEQLRLPLIIAGGLLVGVFCGAHVLESAQQQGDISLFGHSVVLAELVVLTTYFLLLSGLGLFTLRQGAAERHNVAVRTGWLAGWQIPPYAEFAEFGSHRLSIPAVAWFGLAVGFLSGLLGISGGLILLPGLIYLLGMKTHQAMISSLVIAWIISAQSTTLHAWHGNVSIPLVMALLCGGTIGARLGTELSTRLGDRQLRERFGWLLLGTALVIAGQLGRLLLA